jgi:hypothetical protein
MSFKVFSVGYSFPGNQAQMIAYHSAQTLLDADIIVFEPTFYKYQTYEYYQGKPSLSDHSSFHVKEHAAHWRSELNDAFNHGKTIIIFLSEPFEVWRDTGKREYSGTGKNRQTTRIVEMFSSYAAIPFPLEVNLRHGETILPKGNLTYLSAYWSEFGKDSPYEVTIKGTFDDTLLTTKSGGFAVGAAMRSDKGAVVFVPPVSYDEEKFIIRGEDGAGDKWNQKAVQFGKRLVSAIVKLHQAIKSETTETPAPDWAKVDSFRLSRESILEGQIEAKREQLEIILAEKQELDAELEKAGKLRGLLYEQGKPLERVVIHSLKLMGFEAEGLAEGDSEFDVVITSQEGRFLGEAEGKDNRAINIEKLSQLERNINEDFQREEVSEHARGILFGNAFRFTTSSERGDFFTAKCLSGANRAGIALVRTPDIFEPARYLQETDDQEYARACRQAIVDGAGTIVVFPAVPLPLVETQIEAAGE